MNDCCRIAFALALVLAVSQAAAQWAWRDDRGAMVFSDQPPPPSVTAGRIVRQPAARTDADRNATKAEASGKDKSPPAPAAAPKDAASSVPRPRAQPASDAERFAAEQQARKEQRDQDCERMRRYLLALESGQRIAIPDAQGNPIVIDDATRANEVSQARQRLEGCSGDSAAPPASGAPPAE